MKHKDKMDNKTEKAKYRAWAKDLRQGLDLKKISIEIESKLKNLNEYKSAKTVMSYLAKDLEVSLNGLFEDNSKSWFLPVIVEGKDEIVAVQYFHGKTKLNKNRFDILEPEIMNNDFLDQTKRNLDLILVPGLCFDKSGNRLGFGMGFYDQFLKLNPNSFKIGCCPKECLIDNLPKDPWDVVVDLVITT